MQQLVKRLPSSDFISWSQITRLPSKTTRELVFKLNIDYIFKSCLYVSWWPLPNVKDFLAEHKLGLMGKGFLPLCCRREDSELLCLTLPDTTQLIPSHQLFFKLSSCVQSAYKSFADNPLMRFLLYLKMWVLGVCFGFLKYLPVKPVLHRIEEPPSIPVPAVDSSAYSSNSSTWEPLANTPFKCSGNSLGGKQLFEHFFHISQIKTRSICSLGHWLNISSLNASYWVIFVLWVLVQTC